MGRATATLLAEAGANVVIADIAAVVHERDVDVGAAAVGPHRLEVHRVEPEAVPPAVVSQLTFDHG